MMQIMKREINRLCQMSNANVKYKSPTYKFRLGLYIDESQQFPQIKNNIGLTKQINR